MKQLHGIRVEERRRRERSVWRTGLLVSVVLHLLLFLGWQGDVIPDAPFAAAGPRAGDDRAAAGSMQAMNIRTPPPRRIVPPPLPIEVDVEVEPVDFEDELVLDAAAVMGDEPGPLEGPGLDDGTGEGDGGTAEEGRNRLQPAAPRGMIIPPTNRELRGTEVQVWVFVDEQGRVVADSTRLDPPTRDRSFNRRLIEEAAEWVFRPALRAGQPVASWFPYRISM
ncbi:MAG: hypothetical protein R3304_05420 [Longimicrobiales bacterium]|nr:hypothetical protein [Longimicrobiales bacterium]